MKIVGENMPSKVDYYEMLGLQGQEDNAEVRKAYRKMVKKYHPDESKDREEAEKKLKEINKAYKTLSDSKSRAIYDKSRSYDSKDSNTTSSNTTRNNTTSSDSSRSSSSAKNNDKRNAPRRGADIKTDVEITFEQATSGVNKNIMVSTIKDCKDCNGKSKVARIACKTCSGEGKVRGSRRFEVDIPAGISDGHVIRLAKKGESGEYGGENGDLLIKVFVQKERKIEKRISRRGPDIRGSMEITFEQSYYGTRQNVTLSTTEHCNMCRGKDKEIRKACTTCSGRGKVRRSRSFEITIPMGISDGHIIRLAKKGEKGEHGGENGDILINVSVQKHPFFDRVGDDVYVDLPISLLQSNLGSEIEIPMLDGGAIKCNIKPLTRIGTQILIGGKGFPNIKDNDAFGDLIVTLIRAR